MPQRFLRPGITNSARWNRVSLRCQSLYIRLLTLVDDYGRYDGRPAVIWGQCFAIWNAENPDQQITCADVCSDLQQLAAKELINTYSVGDKDVVEITQWQERVREGSVSKWPENPNREEVAATCSNLLLPSSPPSPSPTPLSELGQRIGRWFRRKPTTKWTERELKQLRKVEDLRTPKDEVDLLEYYYFTDRCEYVRHNVETLLNNWNGEIDRARAWKRKRSADQQRF